jgi:CRISPR/Cas system CMR subunit Cmr6 (Cas7 group RAMP superfamily)
MIEQHSTATQQEQRQSMEKEMLDLEKRALAELQRVKSIEEAEKRFQEEARQKYETLIVQLEQSWKQEVSNRFLFFFTLPFFFTFPFFFFFLN